MRVESSRRPVPIPLEQAIFGVPPEEPHPDHLAWVWQDDDLKVWAVEAKLGDSAEAVTEAYQQAREYQFGVPLVYVSAETNLGGFGLSYLKEQLKAKGLGYIRASRLGSALIQVEPETARELDAAIHAENVARVRLRHVFVEGVIGEPVRAERDQRGGAWVVAPRNDTAQWQVCGQVETGSTHTWLSLLAEGAQLGRGFAAHADATKVAALIQQLGGEPRLIVNERMHDGFRPKYTPTGLTWVPQDGRSRLREVLRSARALGQKPKCSPHFEIRFDLWRHGLALTEPQSTSELRGLAVKLKSIRAQLNQLSGT